MDGYNICLSEKCAYCAEFEPTVEKTDITRLEDTENKSMNYIHCEHESACQRIERKMRG